MLRPRGSWEAVDFGARLIRRDWKLVYSVWFLIMAPLALIGAALHFVLPEPAWTWLFLAYWWLEPLADGPVLYIVSRRLFGAHPGVRESLGQTLRLAWRNRIFLLPLMRFHYARSLAMPVTQLEGLAGARRRERMSVINRTASAHGFGVTIIYQHLWVAVYFGVLGVAYLLIPAQYQQAFSFQLLTFVRDSSPAVNAVTFLLVFVTQAMLQPWFIGAGFGLYINRRTHLEAWDVEIAFRRMVNRKRKKPVSAVAAVLFACVLTGVLAPPGDAIAEEQKRPPPEVATEELTGTHSREQVAEWVDEAMSDSRFGEKRKVTQWRRIPGDKEDTGVEKTRDSSMLSDAVNPLAILGEFGLWIAIAILVLLSLPYLRRLFQTTALRKKAQSGPRIQSVEEAEPPPPLPADIPEAVKALLADSPRAALALLYRASLDRLSVLFQIRFPDSATESECLSIVRTSAPSVLDYFGDLLRVWQRLAYANKEPDRDTVLALLRRWSALDEVSAP